MARFKKTNKIDKTWHVYIYVWWWWWRWWLCFFLRLWVLPPYEHGLSPNTGGGPKLKKKHDFFWRFAPPPPLFRSCPHTVIHPFKWRNIHHNISFFFGFDYGKVTSKCRWVTLSLFHAREPWGFSNPNMLPTENLMVCKPHWSVYQITCFLQIQHPFGWCHPSPIRVL